MAIKIPPVCFRLSIVSEEKHENQIMTIFCLPPQFMTGTPLKSYQLKFKVTRMLQKIDETFPNMQNLTVESKEELNLILAELISIQMRYMEVMADQEITNDYNIRIKILLYDIFINLLI